MYDNMDIQEKAFTAASIQIKIDADKKSAAISIVLRDKKKTLTEKEINNVIEKVLNTISKNYNGEIRQ